MSYFVASVSWGKDSTAMLLLILESGLPLNEVVFYDTGMEFQAIYDTRDTILPVLEQAGVKYTELHPENPFVYDMLKRPKTKRDGAKVEGDGWCGGPCRWGTFKKTHTLDTYTKGAHVYIGLAADEPNRLKNMENWKSSPLAERGMTEAAALATCYQNGIEWWEDGGSGKVRLYDILDRVSCWCCVNKNLKELRNIYRYLPPDERARAKCF